MTQTPLPITPATLQCHAKLNLSLLIYKGRRDGYHPLRSVFQTISLHDTLMITPIPEKTLTISSNNSDVPLDKRNILFKVYSLIQNDIANGFCIHIDKHIPMGGGLGGGSSNAAGFIYYLTHHYPKLKSRLTPKKISLKIGADVPFFLQGYTALVSGIGETIRTLPIQKTPAFLLILPHIHSDTKTIYQTFDKEKPEAKRPGPTPKWMIKNHIGHNDLKDIVFNLNPELKHFETALKAEGLPQLYMSGSGSTLFIPLHTETEEKNILRFIKKTAPQYQTYNAEPISKPAIQVIKRS